MANKLPQNFNEKLYLEARPDVAAAVKEGKLSSGAEHYLIQGFQEDNTNYNNNIANYSAAQSQPKPQLTMADYIKQASGTIGGDYNQRLTTLNNNANMQVQGYDNQKTGINRNFNNQIKSNNINTRATQRQFNNNVMSRGLGRSSIAVTGISGIADSGNRRTGEIQQARTSELGNIDALKTLVMKNLGDSQAALEIDKQNAVNSEARRLYEWDDSVNFRNKSYEDSQNWKNSEWNRDTERYLDQQQWQQKEWDRDENRYDDSQQWQQKTWDRDQQRYVDTQTWQQKLYENDNYWKDKNYTADQNYKSASLAQQAENRRIAEQEAAVKAQQASEKARQESEESYYGQVFGLLKDMANAKDEDGNYRYTTDDLYSRIDSLDISDPYKVKLLNAFGVPERSPERKLPDIDVRNNTRKIYYGE